MRDIDYITDTSSLNNAIAYIIQRCNRRLRLSLAKFLQNSGANISPEQWYLLFRLFERPGQSQSELADEELNDHPNITRLLDALQRRDLVRREPDPDDRRRTLVYLTDRGQDLVATLLPQVVEERKRIFRGLNQDDLDRLVETVHQIERNLGKDDK